MEKSRIKELRNLIMNITATATIRLECYNKNGTKTTNIFTSLDAANEFVDMHLQNHTYARIDVFKDIVTSRLLFRHERN